MSADVPFTWSQTTRQPLKIESFADIPDSTSDVDIKDIKDVKDRPSVGDFAYMQFSEATKQALVRERKAREAQDRERRRFGERGRSMTPDRTGRSRHRSRSRSPKRFVASLGRLHAVQASSDSDSDDSDPESERDLFRDVFRAEDPASILLSSGLTEKEEQFLAWDSKDPEYTEETVQTDANTANEEDLEARDREAGVSEAIMERRTARRQLLWKKEEFERRWRETERRDLERKEFGLERDLPQVTTDPKHDIERHKRAGFIMKALSCIRASVSNLCVSSNPEHIVVLRYGRRFPESFHEKYERSQMAPAVFGYRGRQESTESGFVWARASLGSQSRMTLLEQLAGQPTAQPVPEQKESKASETPSFIELFMSKPKSSEPYKTETERKETYTVDQYAPFADIDKPERAKILFDTLGDPYRPWNIPSLILSRDQGGTCTRDFAYLQMSLVLHDRDYLHSNGLLISHRKKTVEHFEPNGIVLETEKTWNASELARIIRHQCKSAFPGYTVISPIDFCPMKGPQRTWRLEQCASFSLMYLHLRLLNPRTERDVVVAWLVRGGAMMDMGEYISRWQQWVFSDQTQSTPMIDLASAITDQSATQSTTQSSTQSTSSVSSTQSEDQPSWFETKEATSGRTRSRFVGRHFVVRETIQLNQRQAKSIDTSRCEQAMCQLIRRIGRGKTVVLQVGPEESKAQLLSVRITQTREREYRIQMLFRDRPLDSDTERARGTIRAFLELLPPPSVPDV